MDKGHGEDSTMEDTALRLRRCPPEMTAATPQPPPGTISQHADHLSRTRSVSAFEVWKALSRRPHGLSSPFPKSRSASSCATPTIREETLFAAEPPDRREQCCPSSFNSSTSRLVLERIMSQSDVSPLTSGRLSHSSGTLNITGSATSSPPLSPSEELEDDDLVKMFRTKNKLHPLITSGASCLPTSSASLVNTPISGARTVGRWLKDRREKKKEEARVHNAQLHAAVSVAAVAAAVAAITAATAAASSSVSSDRNKEDLLKMDMAVASAATLIAAQCVEAAEAMGAEREHLASVVSSAVNVRTHDDVTTLTAAAATALRGAATLKARSIKDVWNIVAVAPVERGIGFGLCGKATTVNPYSSCSGEILARESFLGVPIPEFLASGAELLKRTRKGDLHWKIVSVYINSAGQVILKMKSKHVVGTVTKKDKNVVIDVCEDIPPWPGRHLFDDGEERRYFGLKTVTRGVVEFECKNRWEYDIWTHGVSRLLSAAAAGKSNTMPSLVRRHELIRPS